MTRQEFADLASNHILLLDGATGSNLIKAGMPRGFCPEEWILENPEAIINLQRAYAEAGSNIVYAPTFTCNRHAMANFGLADQLQEMNIELVKLSRQAVGEGVLVAGDLTTTGVMLEPRGPMTYERLLDIYKEQITYLCEAGVDLLVAETMLGVDETMAVLDAANEICDLPVMCSLSLEADGNALFGGSGLEAVETLQEMGASAIGVNCSVGPDQLEAVIRNMAAVSRVPIIAKPNAGMPVITETGEAVYRMSEEEFAKHMKVLVDAGAGIIGGCCGTAPGYIAGLKKMLEENTI